MPDDGQSVEFTSIASSQPIPGTHGVDQDHRVTMKTLLSLWSLAEKCHIGGLVPRQQPEAQETILPQDSIPLHKHLRLTLQKLVLTSA